MMPLLSAALAATLTAPLLVSLYVYVLIGSFQPKGALLLIMMLALVSLAHVLLLGLPAFFALRWRGWLQTRMIAAAGLLAGALPMAVITWPYPLSQPYPYSGSGMWHGRQVDFVADGLPTMFGWFSYLEGVATFGFLGVVSSLAFWFTWLYCRRTVGVAHPTRNFEAIGGFPDPQMK